MTEQKVLAEAPPGAGRSVPPAIPPYVEHLLNDYADLLTLLGNFHGMDSHAYKHRGFTIGDIRKLARDIEQLRAASSRVPPPAVERCQVWVPGYPRRRCGADARTQVRTADGDVLAACAACAAKLGAAASRVPPHPEQE